MQLSPLQSRLAASILASCLLLALYLLLFSPHFALAAELSGISVDHAAAIHADLGTLGEGNDRSQALDARPEYEPDFPLFDRSIMGRATSEPTTLTNNAASKHNLNEGEQAVFIFEYASVSGREAQELRRRSDGSESREEKDDEEDIELVRRASPTKTLWISANTCLQPDRPSTANATSMDPPQLTLYVSTSSDNTSPGPMADSSKQKLVVFDEGAVMYNLTLDATAYFTIGAPNVSDWFTSNLYNFEIAASTDQSYHSYNDAASPNLYWVDSDAGAALLTTGNLDSSINMTGTPYDMFAYGQNDKSIVGVRNSYCGLQQYAQIGGSRSILPKNMMTTSMAKRMGGSPRQEFYVTGLNRSSSYRGQLVQKSASTGSSTKRATDVAGGGGIVFKETDFNTKSTNSCMVLSNLTFCDQNAYSVPGNETKYGNGSIDELKQFYDSIAESNYNNFLKNLMQFPCEAANDSQYSLVKTCDNCKTAYKNWICFVTIPRCEDFSKDDDWLVPRNINAQFPDGSFVDQDMRDALGNTPAFNSSRVAEIDSTIEPGPYKEMLPCEDLCYDLVQSCPSALGFSCPQGGMTGFNTSYGLRNEQNITCNYPGSAHLLRSSAPQRGAISWVVAPVTALCAMLLLLL